MATIRLQRMDVLTEYEHINSINSGIGSSSISNSSDIPVPIPSHPPSGYFQGL